MKNSIKNPLVSITIPTLDSEKTLKITLESIKNQTFQDYEIIIVDSGSKDKTLEIAKQYTSKIYHDPRKLLGARQTGLLNSSGEIVFLLDSDQILHKTTLERAINLIKTKNYDMLFLEEDSYKPRNIIEKLSSIDRKATHKQKVIDPSLSVLLPRVFKKDLLLKVFKKIESVDPTLFDYVTLHDHAITYYESYKISKKVGYVPQAVFHREPTSISELFHHYYKWGTRSSKKVYTLPREYSIMFEKKLNHRYMSVQLLSINFFLNMPIIAIKGLGYYSGLIYSKIKN
ncbi:hypothetical protein COU54_00630 [Candidatus Pacearchaeota archaeon CG10_big_fil_rev_8_21_14_0_10_31_24]|nr:MAG: hypothetical protein COU54_00630 [Candidatus Pacearchaeota archaeon CG10_big_fil_rev_8_21_14_0_10_31_24]